MCFSYIFSELKGHTFFTGAKHYKALFYIGVYFGLQFKAIIYSSWFISQYSQRCPAYLTEEYCWPDS